MQNVPGSGDTADSATPEQIGPYRIVRILGEGGMGVVYEAEQTERVRRRVALKTMKVGMDTAEVVRRFESERQALAVMSHPGIAKVFDAGATPEGRPYFAMELVDGVRLDEFCDSERLTNRERATLFITICEAIQHAHVKGVIHRDLKPSNILVTKVDGRPLAKVIDFGVAKATGPWVTQETAVTTYGQPIGTLAYMSPEQAEASALDVDTRTDIYSLGVVLYELLVGAVPLSPKDLGPWPFLAHLTQPDLPVPTPLRRWTGLPESERERLAQHRRSDPRRLMTDLGSDVQWVVLKAIEKDRDRRYETADGLAADLRRFLAYEPVAAHPPSRSYRLRKFARRNRPVVAMAAVVAALSIVYAVSMAVQVRRVGEERDRAENEAETAQQTARFMTDLFRVSNPSEARGRQVTALEILERGTERITTELGDQPGVQHQLLTVMGDVHTNLGLYDEAELLLLAGLDAARRAAVTPDIRVASSLQQLAWLYQTAGRHDEAVPLVRGAQEITLEHRGERSWEYANVLQLLGQVQRDRGEFVEARAALEQAIDVRRDVLGPEHVDVAWGLFHLGWLEFLEGRVFEAKAIYEEALANFDRTLDADDPARAYAYNDMAVVLRRLDDQEGALAMHQNILELRERTLGPNHPSVAVTLDNMANVYWELSDHERALAVRNRALAIREGALGHEHSLVALTLSNIGLELESLGRYREAVEAYDEAIQIREATGELDSPEAASPMQNLGQLYRVVGRYDRARPLLERALALREQTQGPDHPDLLSVLANMGYTDVAQGRYGTGVRHLERAVAVSEQALGREAPTTIVQMGNLGSGLLGVGAPDRALEVLEGAWYRIEGGDEDFDPLTAARISWLMGRAHRALGDEAAATERFERTLQLARGAEGPRELVSREYEMRYCLIRGDVDCAVSWLERLIAGGYANAELLQDTDLEALRRDPRFDTLTADIRREVGVIS